MPKVNLIKRLGNNRYFLSITLLSFFVFTVLTSLALFASFTIYRSDVKNKAVSMQLERLNAYGNQVDIKYNKILSSVEQLVSDKSILEWIHREDGDKDLYLLRTILDRLNYVNVFNEAVYTLEVYNASSGSVLSNYYGYSAGNGNGALINERRGLYEDFMKNNNIKQLAISSETINSAPAPTIVLLSSLPAYNKNGAIGTVIQAGKLLPQNIDHSENVFVVDSKNPSVYFMSSAAGPFIPEGDVGAWIGEMLEGDVRGNVRTFEIHGGIYYSASRNILNNRFKLLTLVPEEGIEVNFRDFYAYFRAAFALVLVLSVFCSFLIYRTAHRPIKRIADGINKKMQSIYVNKSDLYLNDDLKYLDNTFNMIISKNSEIERIFLDHKDFFRENTLRNLLYGKKEEGGYWFYGNNYLNGGQGNFIVLIFNFDGYSRDTGANILEVPEKPFFRGLIDSYKGDYLRTGPGQYTLLVNLKNQQDLPALLEDIRRFQESVRGSCGSTLTVGVSSVRHKLDDICLCYDEAQEAVKYKTLLGSDRIINSGQLRSEKTLADSFSIQEGQLLIKKLRTEGEKEISGIIIKMIDEKTRQHSIELLNAFLLYISFCISQVGMEYNIGPDILFDNDLFKIMTEYDTVEEKKAYLINQCKKILAVRSKEQKKYKKLSGEIAIKYIEENYNKPISLDIVASELRMSPSYLSRLIKQELGMNFVAYLNKLRIDRAAGLLRKEQLTAKEISARVGYDNEHTFIRNFKSITGKTPADYRNSAAHNAFLAKMEEAKSL